MKLWKKAIKLDELVETFTIGQDPEFDLQIAKYDVQGTLAHIKMLQSIGFITAEELQSLEKELEQLSTEIEKGEFKIEQGVEDVHSQIELLLTRQLGSIGEKIHTGRSRNDQVLVALRLFYRAEIQEIVALATALSELLLQLSKKHQDKLMPGYTHTQVAMVSSFGMWFSAYAETLIDDLSLLKAVYQINNHNPLGSAAGFGSSIPLNRQLTTDLLAFQSLSYNSLHAQMGRGKTEQFLSFAIAAIGSTLARLSSDIILFSNENFRFVKLPDEFTTGSSIMPHKKNPDVFELIRGHSNLFQSLPTQVQLMTTNLISGYHRDFQLLKSVIFPAITHLKQCLLLTTKCLEGMELNPEILKSDTYKYLFTVEAVNDLVKQGVPFRKAYQQISTQIKENQFKYFGTVNHTHEGSIGNLCLPEIRRKLSKAIEGF